MDTRTDVILIKSLEFGLYSVWTWIESVSIDTIDSSKAFKITMIQNRISQK